MRRALFTFLSAVALIATGVVGAVAVGGTGTVDPPPRIAFLANGIVPADALAAGAIAGQLGAPLFTTPADSLNGDARDGILAYDPELVIVLGGPVAIADSVVLALAQATSLSVRTTEAPADGIVRVAGPDRFATARAVADLLSAYDPSFLPVDATALGAVDAATADMADDSDLLDGLDSTDFALSDRSCDPGEVVTAIGEDGNIVCAPDQDEIDGGDAATLDGLDSTDFALSDRSCDPGEVVTAIGEDGNIVCAPDQDEIDGGDAATLNGLGADSLTRVAFDRLDADFAGSGTAASVTITAPVDGYLHITSSILFSNGAAVAVADYTSGSDPLDCDIFVNGVDVTESGQFDMRILAGTTSHCTDTWVEPVAAGDHLVTLAAQFVAATTTIGDATLSVIFSPFGADGTPPVLTSRSQTSSVEKQDD